MNSRATNPAQSARRAQWRQKAEDERESAALFAQNHQRRPELDGPVALRLESLLQFGIARPAKPAERLLRAMPDQGRARDHPNNQ